MLDPNLRNELRELYDADSQLGSVPRAAAIALGHTLLEAGYKKTHSYIKLQLRDDAPKNLARELTVRTALVNFPRQQGDEKKTALEVIDESGGIVGPYYSESDGEPFCPAESVAVWYPPEQ